MVEVVHEPPSSASIGEGGVKLEIMWEEEEMTKGLSILLIINRELES